MNFGGIIAGALSGGAQAVGQIADDNLKEQAAMRAEQRSLQLNFEKFKQEADYKLRLDLQQRQREADDTERLTARADMNMRNKDAAAIDSLNDKVGGDAPEMSRDEIAQLLKDNPEYRKVWEDAKYMDPRKQSGIIGEQITAAREVGADPTVRKDLQTTYDRTVTAERDAAREYAANRRLDQADERETRRAAEAAARLDLDRARFEALQSGSSKLTKAESINLNTTIATQRKGINELKKERDQIKLMGGDQSRLKEIDDEIEVSNNIIKSANQLLQTSLDGRALVPPPAPAPAPSPSTPTSGGKPSWQSQQAYNDEVAIKIAEWQTEKNPEIKAGIRRELLRIGVDPEKRNSDNRGSGPGAIPQINSREELNALPKGSRYIAPDGTTRIKS